MEFELENQKYTFARVSTQDALEIRALMMKAYGKAENKGEADLEALSEIQPQIDNYALKYLKVKNADGTWLEKPDLAILELKFSNPFFVVEISKNFMDMIQNFLQALPHFHNQNKKR